MVEACNHLNNKVILEYYYLTKVALYTEKIDYVNRNLTFAFPNLIIFIGGEANCFDAKTTLKN